MVALSFGVEPPYLIRSSLRPATILVRKTIESLILCNRSMLTRVSIATGYWRCWAFPAIDRITETHACAACAAIYR